MADQTNAEVSDERLREIIAGCEGVTQGPWTFGAQWLCAKAPTLSDYKYLAQVPLNDYDSARWNVDSAHIARLDPDTVKALATELLTRRSVTSQASEGAEFVDSLIDQIEQFYQSQDYIGTGSPTDEEIARAEAADAEEVKRLRGRAATLYASPVSKRVERLETALTEARAELKAAFYEGRASYHRVGGGNGEFAWEHSDTKSKADGGRS